MNIVSTASTNRPYDLIIYGATGYSGKLIAHRYFTLLRSSQTKDSRSKFHWAISGRNSTSLHTLQAELSQLLPSVTSPNPTDEKEVKSTSPLPDIIVAQAESLSEMTSNVTSQCRVVLNCAGPYILCGETIIQACISTSTHYLDITGEPAFLRRVVWAYHEPAKSARCFLIPCCGFDCVPVDVGVLALLYFLHSKYPSIMQPNEEKKKFTHQFSVESFLHWEGSASTGTVTTLLESLAPTTSKGQQLAKATSTTVPKAGGLRPPSHFNPGWSSTARSWVVPLPSADPHIIMRCAALSAVSPTQSAKAPKVLAGTSLTLTELYHQLHSYKHWYRLASFWQFLITSIKMLVMLFLVKIMPYGKKVVLWFFHRGKERDCKKNAQKRQEHFGPSKVERQSCSNAVDLFAQLQSSAPSLVDRVKIEDKFIPVKCAVSCSDAYTFTAAAAVSCTQILLQAPALNVSSEKHGEEIVGGAFTLTNLFAQLPWHTGSGGSCNNDDEATLLSSNAANFAFPNGSLLSELIRQLSISKDMQCRIVDLNTSVN